MKIIDRYVAGNFIRNYILSFCVLVGMYVVLDMLFNIDELAEVNAKATGMAAIGSFAAYIADFYFYQIFLYFVQLGPIIPVVAAGFTLIRMIRFNELIALLSSGVSLQRIAMPMILIALVLNALVIVDQELLIPNMIPKLIRKHDYGSDSDAKWFPIAFLRDDSNRTLSAGRYHPTANPPKMEFITVLEMDDAYHPVRQITARSAEWDEAGGAWRLTQGLEESLPSRDGAVPRTGRPVLEYRSGLVTPEEIQLYRSGEFVEMLSTRRINELLERPESYGRENLMRVKHARGTVQVWTNMTVLLLAIGAILVREPNQLKHGIGRCIVLCGLCMGTAFTGQEFAGTPFLDSPKLLDAWPALMAWMPIFLYFPMAVYWLAKTKT